MFSAFRRKDTGAVIGRSKVTGEFTWLRYQLSDHEMVVLFTQELKRLFDLDSTNGRNSLIGPMLSSHLHLIPEDEDIGSFVEQIEIVDAGTIVLPTPAH